MRSAQGLKTLADGGGDAVELNAGERDEVDRDGQGLITVSAFEPCLQRRVVSILTWLVVMAVQPDEGAAALLEVFIGSKTSKHMSVARRRHDSCVVCGVVCCVNVCLVC
jgi:hypothetical protein